jgi:hypothetical protein
VGAHAAPTIVKQRIQQPLQTPEFPNHDVLLWVGVMSGQYLRCVTGMRQFSDFGGTVVCFAFAPLPLRLLQSHYFDQRPRQQGRNRKQAYGGDDHGGAVTLISPEHKFAV